MKSLEDLDAWLEVTGAIAEESSWYWELQSIIEDAVAYGALAVLSEDDE